MANESAKALIAQTARDLSQANIDKAGAATQYASVTKDNGSAAMTATQATQFANSLANHTTSVPAVVSALGL